MEVDILFSKQESPSVGEWQDREAGVGGLVSRRRGDGIGGFQRRNQITGPPMEELEKLPKELKVSATT